MYKRSGVPTIRNKVSGHGQGMEVVEIPSYLAAHQLHLTATTILFLSEALGNYKHSFGEAELYTTACSNIFKPFPPIQSYNFDRMEEYPS